MCCCGRRLLSKCWMCVLSNMFKNVSCTKVQYAEIFVVFLPTLEADVKMFRSFLCLLLYHTSSASLPKKQYRRCMFCSSGLKISMSIKNLCFFCPQKSAEKNYVVYPPLLAESRRQIHHEQPFQSRAVGFHVVFCD